MFFLRGGGGGKSKVQREGSNSEELIPKEKRAQQEFGKLVLGKIPQAKIGNKRLTKKMFVRFSGESSS